MTVALQRSSSLFRLSGQLLLAALLSVLSLSCASHLRRPASQAEVMARAETYRLHRWWASEKNVKHAPDSQGVRVDTPDATTVRTSGAWRVDAWNTGMPYQWGGFDTPGSFNRKLQQGLAAGDIYTNAKRAGLESTVSQEAAGIDCSGFISRCWGLEKSFSTRELPALCRRLNTYQELQAGDIVNTFNAHVLLFCRWTSPQQDRALFYEAGCHPHWKVVLRELDVRQLRGKNYVPLRYRYILDAPAEG